MGKGVVKRMAAEEKRVECLGEVGGCCPECYRVHIEGRIGLR